MSIYLNFEYGEDSLRNIELEKLAQFVLEHEIENEGDREINVSITFVPNEEIQHLNAQYRGIDAPTDVLSFELECDEDDSMVFPNDPDTPRMINLGDVIIAPDVARAQCEKFNTTFEGEISLLLVHGLLHLCGYDHIEDEDAKVMQAREVELLREWQVAHPNVKPPEYEKRENYEIDATMVIGEH